LKPQRDYWWKKTRADNAVGRDYKKYFMNWIKKIFGSKALDSRLLGSWISDQTDETTKQTLGDVTMTFTPKGELIYKIKESDKVQIINMTFWTEGEYVISDQPSNPRKEKTRFDFDDEKLILEFEGYKTIFLKSVG
jgi:hypothetical protein